MLAVTTTGPAVPETWAQAILPQFLDLTASRQIEIEIERGNLERGVDPRCAAREIGKTVHKIAGTAASLGFVALGTQAQTVEAICRQFAANLAPGQDAAVTSRLLCALDDLTRELDLVLVTTV